MEDRTPVTPSTPVGGPVQDSTASASSTVNVNKRGNAGNHGNDALPDAPRRPKGPNASAILVGLVAMLIAGLVIARETMALSVDWSRLGPGAIIGLGVVMAVIGAIGLVRRRDDV